MKISVTFAIIFFLAKKNTNIKAASIPEPQFAILVQEQPVTLVDTNSTNPEGRFFVTHGLALLKGAVIGVKAGVVGGAALAGGASQLSSLASGLTNATSQLTSFKSTISNATSQLTESFNNATSHLSSLASSQINSISSKLLGNNTAAKDTDDDDTSIANNPICIVTRRRRSLNANSDYDEEKQEYVIQGRQVLPVSYNTPADATGTGDDVETFPILGTAPVTTAPGTAPVTTSMGTADATGTFADSGSASSTGTGTGSNTNSRLGTGTATTTQTVTATGTVAPAIVLDIAKTPAPPLTCIIITKDASETTTTQQPNILASFGLGKRKR